jgi:hypothetical protein
MRSATPTKVPTTPSQPGMTLVERIDALTRGSRDL